MTEEVLLCPSLFDKMIQHLHKDIDFLCIEVFDLTFDKLQKIYDTYRSIQAEMKIQGKDELYNTGERDKKYCLVLLCCIAAETLLKICHRMGITEVINQISQILVKSVEQHVKLGSLEMATIPLMLTFHNIVYVATQLHHQVKSPTDLSWKMEDGTICPKQVKSKWGVIRAKKKEIPSVFAPIPENTIKESNEKKNNSHAEGLHKPLMEHVNSIKPHNEPGLGGFRYGQGDIDAAKDRRRRSINYSKTISSLKSVRGTIL